MKKIIEGLVEVGVAQKSDGENISWIEVFDDENNEILFNTLSNFTKARIIIEEIK
ncbi:hypothetical protein NSS71_25315 [Niallia sp. FSL W8-0951]|uniref:hypothetical protein n=1 Tax=Niallia sp. FSL W8-0951 TaxID=2954639 RepID=UPI0030F65B81